MFFLNGMKERLKIEKEREVDCWNRFAEETGQWKDASKMAGETADFVL